MYDDLDSQVNRSVDILMCAYDYLERRGQSLVRPGFGRGCKHGSKYLRARRRSEQEVWAMREEIASEIEYRVQGGC
jgi:hypothetical protein